MLIDNLFEIGQTVYAKTDPDQNARMVISILVQRNNLLKYQAVFNTNDSWFLEMELSSERDLVMTTTGKIG